ncbi:MAG: acetate kinase [Thermoanaerobacteraceae bacterium]|nr:acetate kinase [Thermoanaerobacteraceae bacterium]
MNILVCNVGSTSLKYGLLNMTSEESLAWGRIERIGSDKSIYSHKDVKGFEFKQEAHIPNYKTGINLMIKNLINNGEGVITSLEEISSIGFKVVHAKDISGVQLLTDEVLKAMEEYNCIAPAHNPPYIDAIKQFRELIPEVPLVGSFETGFHKTIPPEAFLYGIPYELYKDHGIRKYGFHGASHEYVSTQVSEILGRKDLKIVTCHLGGSSSLCAVKNGESVDTTMGFSLQSGILNNNRCGDIDPFVLIYLMEKLGYTLDEVKHVLTKKGGLLGISGVSNDLRDIEEAAEHGNERAIQCIETYCYNIKKYIGAFASAMGGLDVIAFAGGIGENGIKIREKVCKGLEFLGVYIDHERNKVRGIEKVISTDSSPVKVMVIPTNEEIIVARKVKQYLEGIR